MKKPNYRHTIIACYAGYITQAIVNNFAPLLFLTFRGEFGISLDKIALLISVNFAVQLLVDLLSARYVDKLGYRACMVAACTLSGAGLVGLGVLPELLWDPYAGLLCAVVLYAVGGGLLEVLVSPIVEACPTTHKEAAMSLLHSFYCWGHVFVILLSTGFFALFGIGYWRILACFWAILPLCTGVAFLRVPILHTVEERERMKPGQLLRSRVFWLLVVLMICSGASEQAMSQWASAFAEAGLQVSKTVGDLAGPCLFAILMGFSRILHARLADRVPLRVFMAVCGVLSIAGYLLASLSTAPVPALVGCGLCGLACGVMWPGTFSVAARAFPAGGTAMFALLALAGDMGCSVGPGLVGLVSASAGDQLKAGLLAAVVFPLLLLGALGDYALQVRKRR